MLRRTCPVKRPWPARAAAAIKAAPSGYLSRQAARPHGLVGQLLGRIWIRETAAVNDVAIDLLDARAGERVVEIGCGPGRALGWLAAEGATVRGVDVSPAMLAAARRRNAHLVAEGRLELLLGDGTHLPLNDDSADAVMGVHTIYFWPDPATTLAEVARVLRPRGRLVLAFRAGEHPLPRRLDPSVYRVPTTQQLTSWLDRAGFVGVEVRWRPEVAQGVAWVTALAPSVQHGPQSRGRW
jgi:SAM-dependent methyltransferase